MKVSFTPQIKMAIYGAEKQSAADKKAGEYQNNTSYNPIAYRDYNISFGERLFRSPENFYEQDFNRDNMPKTLYDFIYTGDETFFKRTIPPAQAMGIVFKDIKDAKNLDEVKDMFPEEPLFENLSSTPKVKSREGLLGAINLFKDDPEYIANNRTLFKNGENDLGMYILKKIYLEGKPLKEINKDFKKDVSVYYEGFEITPKDYMAFGIKFPKHSFWHSYIATREDFEYVRVPRHLTERAGSPSGTSSGTRSTSSQKPRNPRYRHVTDWEVDKIAGAVTNSGGSKAKIRSQLDRDKSEASNFVAEYMSEIMSVTMERLHMSPEMKAFFNNYDNINEDQRAKLKKYWDSPKLREDMSYVMKSTIRMFMEAYDEDGENEYFKELIDYAHNIKPKREAAEAAHNEKQLDYEQIFEEPKNAAKLDEIMAKLEPKPAQEPETGSIPTGNITTAQLNTIPIRSADEFENIAAKKGAQVFKMKLPNGETVMYAYNRKELCNDWVEGNFGVFPTVFKNALCKFMDNTKEVTDEYLISTMLYNGQSGNLRLTNSLGNIADEDFTRYLLNDLKSQIMPPEEINKIAETVAKKIETEFVDKNKQLVAITREVLLEIASQLPFDNPEYRTAIALRSPNKEVALSELDAAKKIFSDYRYGNLTISQLTVALYDAGVRSLSPELRQYVDSRMNFYSAPLTNKEIKQLSNDLPWIVIDFDIKGSKMLKNAAYTQSLWMLAMSNIKKYPNVRKQFLTKFREMSLFPENTCLRGFLNTNQPNKESIVNNHSILFDYSVPDEVKSINTQKIIADLLDNYAEFITMAASYDVSEADDTLKYKYTEFYNKLKTGTPLARQYFNMKS